MSRRGVNIPVYTVDAFTEVAFRGNPAAVCLLSDDTLSDDVLQKIAAEMNLSETAFIKLVDKSDTFEKSDTFGLRWFTPITEVKLCGHATLASAAILFQKLGNESDKIVFKTLSGNLVVGRDRDRITMDFPLGKTIIQSKDQYDDLIKSLGDIPGVEDIVYCQSLRYLLITLTDGWTRREFEDWTPDVVKMQTSTDGLFLLIVSTRGAASHGYHDSTGTRYDFVSRVFAPWAGVSEDPVTGYFSFQPVPHDWCNKSRGSAQTVLADYWSKKIGKTEFFTRQCSKRAGEIAINLEGDRVQIRGQTVIVLEGSLCF